MLEGGAYGIGAVRGKGWADAYPVRSTVFLTVVMNAVFYVAIDAFDVLRLIVSFAVK